MAKFIISINETSYGSVEIEAESEEEAREKAVAAYYDGNVHWGDSEYTITSVALA